MPRPTSPPPTRPEHQAVAPATAKTAATTATGVSVAGLDPSAHPRVAARLDLVRMLRGYFWFIFKNVVGWLCIVASPIVGVLLPGPGGFPLFLIGFALVTFPGKRRLTSRVFRGRRLPIESPFFTGVVTFFSVAVTASAMILVWQRYEWIVDRVPLLADLGLGDLARLLAISALALPVTMLVTWLGLVVLNGMLGWIPRVRRFLRPMLRRWGVRLLPARRRRIGGETQIVQDEILELDDAGRVRLRRAWRWAGPWLRRVVTVGLTVGIVYLVVAPVVREWDDVAERVTRISVWQASLGIVAFGVGLLAFRAGIWRAVLLRLNVFVPPLPASRVWSLGHLSRHLPGRAYQVVRMELARQYDASGPQTNLAQRLEGALTFVAAIVVLLAAVWVMAWERAGDAAAWGGWRPGLVVVAATFPLLLVGVWGGLLVRLLPTDVGVRRLRDPTRLGGTVLLGMFLWAVAGVVWQGTAVWLVLGEPLREAGVLGTWWRLVGAWAAAWAAGHLAPWSLAGIGVREVVFVGVLSVLLPDSLRQSFAQSTPFDPFEPQSWQDVWWAFLFFLSLLLRLSTTLAEVAVATLATAADWKGMVRLASR